MRASLIILSLIVVLHTRYAVADTDIASIAAIVCPDHQVATDDGNAVTLAETARLKQNAAQTAYDAAVRDAGQAENDAKAHPESRKKAAADTAAKTRDVRKAELDAATQAAKSAETAAAKFTLCKTNWSGLAGRQYPVEYLKTFDKNVCDELKDILPTDKNVSNDDRATSDALCRGSEPRSLTTFGTSAVNLVLGVGDLLQAEAKQEVLDYLVAQIGKKFCDYKRGKFELRTWFPDTCKLMSPSDNREDLDASVFNFGDLKDAFNKDLQTLPSNAGQAIYGWIKSRWPNADPYIGAAGALTLIAFDLAKHKKPGEIFEHLGSTADEQTKSVECDFTNPGDTRQKANEKACAALLLFQFARTAAKEYPLSEASHLSTIIQDSLIAFCSAHAVQDKKNNKNGDCVIDATHYQQWHTRLLALWDAVKQMIDLQLSMDTAARTALPAELSKRSAPEVVAALRAFVKAFSDVLGELGSSDDKRRISDDARILDLGFDIYNALVADDPAALRIGLLGLLQSPVLDGAISPPVAHAITVVVSLGTAKDRTEVKDILADVVSPIGSYKSKYGADHAVITLNGFVGFFGGGEYRTNMHSASGTPIDMVRAYAPLKLVAPIGLDATLASWKNAHVGVFLSLVDPLALDVSDDGGTLHADWATLFTPGAYFRVGGFRMPFTLAVGASYVPGRRSTDMCGADRCFDGAIQFGAFLNADVPLLTFH